MIRLLQAYTVSLDGTYHLVDSLVLTYHRALQLLRHTLQTDSLLFSHSLYGHSRHHRYHISHLLCIYHLTFLAFAVLPLLIEGLKVDLQLGLTIAIACCQLEVLILHSSILLFLHLCYLLLYLNYLWWNLSVREVYS